MALLALSLSAPAPARAQRHTPVAQRLVRGVVLQLRSSLDAIRSEGAVPALAFLYEPGATAGPRDRLHETLLQSLEGSLAELSPVRLPAPDPARLADLTAGARASGADYLLVVEARVAGHFLVLTGALHSVRVGFWSRVRWPVTGVRAHAFVRARLDAELRTLLDAAATPAAHFRVEPAPEALAGAPYAGAAADLDGDGLQELALLQGDGLHLWRWVGGEVEPVARWSPPPSGAPVRRSRDVFGAAVGSDLDGDGVDELVAWSSQWQQTFVLSLAGDRLAEWTAPVATSACGQAVGGGERPRLCGVPLAGWPLVASSAGAPAAVLLAAPAPGRNHVLPRLTAWTLTAETPFAPAPAHWGGAGLVLTLPEPGTDALLLGVVGADGVATIRDRDVWSVPSTGTALALVDFEDDGSCEVVTSSDSLPGAPDSLRVHRLAAPGRAVLVWRAESPEIRGLVAGDADNDGVREVLVLAGRGVGVLRAAGP